MIIYIKKVKYSQPICYQQSWLHLPFLSKHIHVNIHFQNQTLYLQPWLHLLLSRSFHVQYSYSQPDSLPTPATSPIFIIVNIFNINIHNQTRYQHRLHPQFSSFLTYSISIFTTRLATNHGCISYYLDLYRFNIHIHNQIRYQHRPYLPFSSFLDLNTSKIHILNIEY